MTLKLVDQFDKTEIKLGEYKEIEIAIAGTGLTDADLAIFFKRKLLDADANALQKGSYSPLSGIEIISNTATSIRGNLQLWPEDFTAAPLAIVPSTTATQLVYTLNLRDAASRVHHVCTGIIWINLTAMQVMP